MKILFICNGNSGLSPIVSAQADSLLAIGVAINTATIVGKGALGYLKNVPNLRKEILHHDPDVVHAHYSLCGIVAAIATSRPIVTSLMGSDVNQSSMLRAVTSYLIKHRWKRTIVKSLDMKEKIQSQEVTVLPNGVNLDLFKPMNKAECRKRLGWQQNARIALFAANPQRAEKNYYLAKQSIAKCDIGDKELKVVHGVPQSDMPVYLNACDLVLLTSHWEGSPNVIKEAMACNVPIVSTAVGDVAQLAGGVDSIWVCEPDARIIAESLSKAFYHTGVVASRQKIIDLGLSADDVARRLVKMYREVIDKR